MRRGWAHTLTLPGHPAKAERARLHAKVGS
jgi:hypothetical protein